MDPNQLLQVETLCAQLYEGQSDILRNEAQQQLLVLQTTVDYIPQCQYILDNSKQAYAQVMASSSLETLITQYWTNLTVDQKVGIRTYVLNLLASHSFEHFVVGSLTKLLCRITKLGWFDSPAHREIVPDVTKFLEATPAHNLIGLKILTCLVDEINCPSNNSTIVLHRKTAISFRDQCLFAIFQIAITTIQQVSQSQQQQQPNSDGGKMELLALQLANSCLQFDFMGTNPEDSVEDVSTVQIPASWQSIARDSSILQLLFRVYSTTQPPRSSTALQCLVQLTSLRRSIFPSEAERTEYALAFMKGIHSILKGGVNLQNEDNYHEMCRLISRMKASYQLAEMLKSPLFSEVIELISAFTIQSFNNWSLSMNSIHYLLSFWGRLVAALPFMRSDSTEAQRQLQLLKQLIGGITEAYIKSALTTVEAVHNDMIDEDPLADEGSVKEQMEKLPLLIHLQYEAMSQSIYSLFEELLSFYQQLLSTTSTPKKLRIIEDRLAWLVYIVAAVIGNQQNGGRSVSSLNAYENAFQSNQLELICDGKLCRLVFQLVHTNEMNTRAKLAATTTQNIELALLTFFRAFKKSYLVDSLSGLPLGSSSNSYSNSSLGAPRSLPAAAGLSFSSYSSASSSSLLAAATAAAASPAASVHPLLSLALSTPHSPAVDADGIVLGGGSAEDISSIFDAMKIGEQPALMNLIINKLCSNIQYWHRSEPILLETLSIFSEMVATYTSSKAFLELESVQFLIHNHNGSHFPFLAYENDNKFRIQFYATLSRLVFTSAEDQSNSFDLFLAHNLEIIQQLAMTPDISAPPIRSAIINCLRDFRGIVSASINKRTFNLLFDVLFPNLFHFLTRVTEVWCDDHIVMIAVLKFVHEFVQNKCQRIVFEQCSANGILLFRETSTILCSYGSRVLALPVRESIYAEKYKGIRVMLNTIVAALTGDYVNFGVFQLYNDPALQNLLDISLQLCLQIPFKDILAFLKLSKAYFGYLEVLFQNHLDVLCGLDSSVFIQLIRYTQDGLQSHDALVSSHCANCIDHLATYIFLHRQKAKPTVVAILNHIRSTPTILDELTAALFNSFLFSTGSSNHWALTRPILPLLLANEESFVIYQNQLIATQDSQDKIDRLTAEFQKLLADIQRSLDSMNRDKFAQRLTLFRIAVRQFLTL